MTYQIKRISADAPEDMDGVLDCFAEAFEEPGPHIGRLDLAYMQNLLASDHFIALAAYEKGKVIGGLGRVPDGIGIGIGPAPSSAV